MKLLKKIFKHEFGSEVLEQIAWIGVILVVLLIAAIAIRDKLQTLANTFLNWL
jgi:hypothetical protein